MCVFCFTLNTQANRAVYVKDRFGVLKMLKSNFVGERSCVFDAGRKSQQARVVFSKKKTCAVQKV